MSDRFLEFVNDNLEHDRAYDDLGFLEKLVSYEFRQTVFELLRSNTISIKHYREFKNVDMHSLPNIVTRNISKVTYNSPLELDDFSFKIERISEADLIDLELSADLKYFPNVNAVFNFECHAYDDDILFRFCLFSDDFSYVFDDHMSYKDILEDIEHVFVWLSKNEYRYG